MLKLGIEKVVEVFTTRFPPPGYTGPKQPGRPVFIPRPNITIEYLAHWYQVLPEDEQQSVEGLLHAELRNIEPASGCLTK